MTWNQHPQTYEEYLAQHDHELKLAGVRKHEAEYAEWIDLGGGDA